MEKLADGSLCLVRVYGAQSRQMQVIDNLASGQKPGTDSSAKNKSSDDWRTRDLSLLTMKDSSLVAYETLF